MNWKLLIKDAFSLIGIVWVLIRWNAEDDFYKFGGIIIVISLVMISIDAHWDHYKKERRFY